MVSPWRDDSRHSRSLVGRRSYFPVSSFLFWRIDGLSVCVNRYRIGTTARIVRGSSGGCRDRRPLLPDSWCRALGFRCSGRTDHGFHDRDPDNSPACRRESPHNGAPPCRYIFACESCGCRRFLFISGGNYVEPGPAGQTIPKQMVVKDYASPVKPRRIILQAFRSLIGTQACPT